MSSGNDHRLVALRLHGLADCDRRWILSRIADLDRIKLEGYLEELKGFQLDPETLLALEQRSGADSAHMNSSNHWVREQILAAEPDWLSRVLQPDFAGHRIGNAISALTPLAYAIAEAAFERRILASVEGSQATEGSARKHGHSAAGTGNMLTRLREAWRR